jgi:CrcB protein
MKLIFLDGIGSFAGGISRYLLAGLLQDKTASPFPFPTLVVNLIGCFIIGCLYGLAEKWELTYESRLFLITGILGGFTTFSAFSVETLHLLKTGQTLLAISYILSSIIFGVGLTFFGAFLFRFVPGNFYP